MAIQTLVVGGEWTFATTFIRKANDRGFDLVMKKHIAVDSVPNASTPKCDLILVLKDFVSHRLCDWAKAEAERLSIKFCETSQKISIAVSDLSHILGITPKEEILTTTKQAIFVPQDVEFLHELAQNIPGIFIGYFPHLATTRKKYFEVMFNHATKALEATSTTGFAANRSRRRQSLSKLIDLFDRYARALRGQDPAAQKVAHSIVMNWATFVCANPISGPVEIGMVKTIAKTLFGYTFTDSEIESLTGHINESFSVFAGGVRPVIPSPPSSTSEVEPLPPVSTPDPVEATDPPKEDDMAKNVLFAALRENPYRVLGGSWDTACDYAEAILCLKADEARAQVKQVLAISTSRQGTPEKVDIYDIRFRWSEDYLKHHFSEFPTFNAFKDFYRKIWAVRIPDAHSPAHLKTYDILRAQSMVNEVVAAPVSEPATEPAPAPTNSESTTPAPTTPAPLPMAFDHCVVSIGSLIVSLRAGAHVFISEVEAESIEADGPARVSVERVVSQNGTTKLYGVNLSI